MSNLSQIQPQRVDFDTSQIFDWLDGLPMIGVPGLGGTLAGTGNVGNGTIAVASVGTGAAYNACFVRVTAIANGQTCIAVVDSANTPIAFGVVGLPVYAAGITFTVTQGPTAFAIGDAFAISVVRVPLDISSFRFDLDARDTIGAPSVALDASSGGDAPTIVNGGASGILAMAVPRARMARCAVKLTGYPYVITASDPATGLKVPAFVGTIYHAASAVLVGRA